jgi:hypothetical protein
MESHCKSCQQISFDDLHSANGVTLTVRPDGCQFCALLFAALRRCKCGREWRMEGAGGYIIRLPWKNELWCHPESRLDPPAEVDWEVRLWARPFHHAVPSPAPKSFNHLFAFEQRLEGVTVCYGRSDILKSLEINLPEQLHDIEAGSNALQDTIVSLRSKSYTRSHASTWRHICRSSLVFTAPLGMI